MTDVLLEALRESGIPAPPSDVVLGKYSKIAFKYTSGRLEKPGATGDKKGCKRFFKEISYKCAVFFDKSGQRKKKLTEADKRP